MEWLSLPAGPKLTQGRYWTDPKNGTTFFESLNFIDIDESGGTKTRQVQRRGHYRGG
jgi:hypothetical protein